MPDHPATDAERHHLARGLVGLLVRRIREDHARTLAAGFLDDMGYDDCPVCLANRQREAWQRWLDRPDKRLDRLFLR